MSKLHVEWDVFAVAENRPNFDVSLEHSNLRGDRLKAAQNLNLILEIFNPKETKGTKILLEVCQCLVNPETCIPTESLLKELKFLSTAQYRI